MITIFLGNKIVSRTANLRATVRYASKYGVEAVGLVRCADGSGSLTIRFGNNANTTIRFADANVAYRWATRRNWL